MDSSSNKMKWIIIAVVAVLFLGFGFWAISASKNKPSKPVEFSNSGHSTSSDSAKLTLTEFGDLQCPACKAFEPAVEQVRAQYKDSVNVVFKHFPLKAAHPNAFAAAMAAEAAAKQGKFWQYHDLLYEKQEEWAPLASPTDKFIEYAKSLKLDTAKFANDLNDKKIGVNIDSQLEEGIKAGVSGTPTFFLNGVMISPNQSFESFKQILDTALISK